MEEQMLDAIQDGDEVGVEALLQSGLDGGAFLATACLYEAYSILCRLLDSTSHDPFDVEDHTCHRHDNAHHSSIWLTAIDTMDMLSDHMNILRRLMELHSLDPLTQRRYVNQYCRGCGKTAFSLKYFCNFQRTHQRTANLYTLLQLGADVPDDDSMLDSMLLDAIECGHKKMFDWLLARSDVVVDTMHVHAMLENRDHAWGKEEMIDLIHRLGSDRFGSRPVGPLRRNVLHQAVCLGDYDILQVLLTVSGASKWSRETDGNDQTPLQVAIDQGLLLQAWLLFSVTVHSVPRQTPVFKEPWKTEAYQRAHAAFLAHVRQEIEQGVTALDPLQDVTAASMIHVRCLVADWYHPSGIGAPDPTDHLLVSETDVEQTIRDWSTTNPLAAMRFHYAVENHR